MKELERLESYEFRVEREAAWKELEQTGRSGPSAVGVRSLSAEQLGPIAAPVPCLDCGSERGAIDLARSESGSLSRDPQRTVRTSASTVRNRSCPEALYRFLRRHLSARRLETPPAARPCHVVLSGRGRRRLCHDAQRCRSLLLLRGSRAGAGTRP